MFDVEIGLAKLIADELLIVESLPDSLELLDQKPMMNSVAAFELNDSVLMFSHRLAANCLHSAYDHLRAWKSLFEGETEPVLAQFSLLRVVAEASVLACWLMDPEISQIVRAQRGVAVKRHDYIEARKFLVHTGRRVEAHDAMREIFEREVRDRKIPRSVLPNVTALFLWYFKQYNDDDEPDRAEYRLGSGVAHSLPWPNALLTDHVSFALTEVGWTDKMVPIRSPDLEAAGLTSTAVEMAHRAVQDAMMLRVKPHILILSDVVE